ncbi:MAG TPA: heme-binding protein [Streptosporangiaceae bacterium]|nr:heme-binding protein [Streptosporangiaceae bacterium]
MPSTITLDRANAAIEAGKAKAKELGIAFTISIVDAGAHLVSVSRMDGAALASVEASQAKARTSVLFAQPTRDLAGAVQPGAPMYGIEAGFRDGLAFVGGGVPILGPDGRVLGAVGVGGGYPDHDNQVAEAAKSAL